MNLVAFLVFTLWAHPFHVSICEIEYNYNENTLQIAHRIFIDDLENALSEMSNEKIYMQRTATEKINQALEKYLQKNFSISVAEKQIEAGYLGYEIENDVVWCYQETPVVESFKIIRVKNSLLLEIFDDQQNIVHVALGGEVKSLKLNRRKEESTLSFK